MAESSHRFRAEIHIFLPLHAHYLSEPEFHIIVLNFVTDRSRTPLEYGRFE